MHAHTHAHTHRSTCLVRLSVCPPSEARLPPWCQWEGRVRQSELRVRSCVSNPSLEWLTYSVTVCSLSKHLPSVLWSAVACLRERERESEDEEKWGCLAFCVAVCSEAGQGQLYTHEQEGSPLTQLWCEVWLAQCVHRQLAHPVVRQRTHTGHDSCR